MCDGLACDLEAIGVSSIFKTIHSVAALARMLPTLNFNWILVLGSLWVTRGSCLKDKNHVVIFLQKSEYDVFRNHLKTYSLTLS
jgi:hypothetical protein